MRSAAVQTPRGRRFSGGRVRLVRCDQRGNRHRLGRRDGDNGHSAGSAYLFDSSTGEQLFKLLPDDGDADDMFGYFVAISGTTAIVGALGNDNENGFAAGAAYLFDTSTGKQTAKLIADDGEEGDTFGISVGISGPPGSEIAVIGAYQDDDNGNRSGSAYLFDTTTGKQIAKLLADDGSTEDFFGISVAIGGPPGKEVAIVGASNDNDNGDGSGSVYLFDATTGEQITKLLADDGAPGDRFGRSVAISGTTAIVGAHLNNGHAFQSGSAYLFDITTGKQIAKLLPSDGEGQDQFGTSVAISGTTAIIGALDDDNGHQSGSAYLFDITTGQELGKILPNDGAEIDLFGRAVAITDTTALAGAAVNDDNGNDSGSAYLFDTTALPTVAKLLADDGAPDDRFGQSIAISGPPGSEVTIVGAPDDADNGDGSGTAYLFDAVTGEQTAKLLPDDGAPGDNFGQSVGINAAPGNDLAIVGSPDDADHGDGSGSAYLFDTVTGQQIAKLVPADGFAGDQFGNAVALNGTPGSDVAIVGAWHDDDNGNNSGAAYLFHTATGEQLFKLLPDDGAANDWFGISVAISGALGNEVAIVGAYGDDDNSGGSGSAYIFDATTGEQLFKLLAEDGAFGDRFGVSVGITAATGHNLAIVGAHIDGDNGGFSGSAYLFSADTGQQLFKLLPGDGGAGDEFGFAVAITAATAIVGAHGDDDRGTDSGSAYLFDTATGEQINKFIPTDSFAGDQFGISVAITGAPGRETAVIGSSLDDDRGDDSGSAYLYDFNCPTGFPVALSSCFITFGSTDNPPCDVANLVDDDDVDQILRSQFGFSAFERNVTEIVIQGNGVDATTMIAIATRDGSTTTNVVAKVKARNYASNEIIEIAQYGVTVPSDDTSHSTAVNSADFIDANGDIEIHLRYVAPAAFSASGFTVGLDQVTVIVE